MLPVRCNKRKHCEALHQWIRRIVLFLTCVPQVLYTYKNLKRSVQPVNREERSCKVHARELVDSKLLERINRGGMADVFLGLVPGGDGRGRTVAVKLLRSDISNLSELVPCLWTKPS